MSEVFSNERLIDYFCLFDINISEIIDISDHIYSNLENTCLTIHYTYKKILQLPSVNYKENYDLNLESIFPVSSFDLKL